MSPAQMAAQFTPRQAARVKYRVLMLHLASVPRPELDALLDNDGEHRWFCYCLDAVARGWRA